MDDSTKRPKPPPAEVALHALAAYVDDRLAHPPGPPGQVERLWLEAAKAVPRLWLYVPDEHVPDVDAFELDVDTRQRIKEAARTEGWSRQLAAVRAAMLVGTETAGEDSSDMQTLCDILVALAYPDPGASIREDADWPEVAARWAREQALARLPRFCWAPIKETSDEELSHVLALVARGRGRPSEALGGAAAAGEVLQATTKESAIAALAERLNIDGRSEKNVRDRLRAARNKYGIGSAG